MSIDVNAPGPLLRTRTVTIDHPIDLLASLPNPQAMVWLRHGQGLVGCDEAARLDLAPGVDRFAVAGDWLGQAFLAAEDGEKLVAFGSFAFDGEAAGSVLIVPRLTIGYRDGRAWLTASDGDEPRLPEPAAVSAHERVRYAGSSLPETAWMEAVDQAAAEVRAGRLEKVVLARDRLVWSREPFDPRVLVARLARRFPSCFTFACDGLVGATPELLVRRSGDRVESLVLAGSAPRGATIEDDARLGEALLCSDKDRSEHEPAVRSVREVLATCCDDLQVDADPWLLRLDNVQHLATSVRGRLAQPLTALELAGRLHPTAAVCGLPRRAALAHIRALEGMQRGRYAGPVGWVDARGDGEWGIALRCAAVDGPRARLFAGNGIVGASLPEAELEETRLKLRAMQSAFEG